MSTDHARWTVCEATSSAGWENPLIATDDVQEAVTVYEQRLAENRGRRWYAIAIFDDNGEGEPLCADSAMERVEADSILDEQIEDAR